MGDDLLEADLLEGVSRETVEKLRQLEALIVTWNARINLVSKQDLSDLWRRHILDSVQLAPLVRGDLIDLGSGGGFPGLVLATLASDSVGQNTFTLIESDQRKCAFLQTARIELGLDTCTVINKRIEQAKHISADVVTARGLATTDVLLNLAQPFLRPNGICIFPKGRSAAAELTAARKRWHIDANEIPSRIDEFSAIIRVRNFHLLEDTPNA